MKRRDGGPLSGIRVVELAGIGPSQLGGMMLTDHGADVVRIDRTGDAAGFSVGAPGRDPLGRGRRSISVGLKSSRGMDVAWVLIERADVLIDPYRPGVAERLGIGPEPALERNPRLIYARMTGWGQEGPLASAAGHDLNYIALAGALDLIGQPGEAPPVPLNVIADFGGGGMLAFGIVAALLERESSGRGQVLDVAMVDGVATVLASVIQLRAAGAWAPGRGTNWLQGAAPWYRAYTTSDSAYVTVGALEGKFYAEMLVRLGLDPAEWPQWDRDLWNDLAARLAAVFGAAPLAHWRAELEGTDACFAPVLDLDAAAAHPQLAQRETYIVSDGVLQAAPAPRFSRTPGTIAGPPPLPGEHTDDVLAELGL